MYERAERALCVLCLLTVVITVWAGTRIYVPPQQYLISYFYAVPALQLLLIVSGVLHLLQRAFRRKGFRSICTCGLAVLAAVILFVRYPGDVEQRRCAINAEIDELVKGIPLEESVRYAVSLRGEKAPYSFAAPLSLALVRRGYDICFADEWGYRFGRALTCRYRQRWYPVDRVKPLELERTEDVTSGGFEHVRLVRGVRVRF